MSRECPGKMEATIPRAGRQVDRLTPSLKGSRRLLHLHHRRGELLLEGGRLAYRQHHAWSRTDDPLGDAPQQQVSDAAPTVCADHDEIDAVLGGEANDLSGRRADDDVRRAAEFPLLLASEVLIELSR